ncbi:hypothetical protein CR513_43382, partial [Mucuna pruriens]
MIFLPNGRSECFQEHTGGSNSIKRIAAKRLASVEKLWQEGLCASLYEGSWILKSWKCAYSVEDFIDRSQNLTRAVGVKEFLNGQSHGNNLMNVLFEKPTASTPEVGVSEKQIIHGLQGREPPTPSVGLQQSLDVSVRNMLVAFTPRVSYQPPLAISSTNIRVNHSYSRGTTPHYSLNPVAFERSYNPSIQSHLVSSQTSQGFVGTVHRKAVAPNPHLPSIHSHFSQRSEMELATHYMN